jgi:putative peptidoglycan lipid II flippase
MTRVVRCVAEVNTVPTRLARSAGLIGAATMTSRVLGVIRETTLAALFGAGNQMDAFNVAFRIPNLLRDLFAEGAMNGALVPAFTRRLSEESRDEAWRLGNLVINALGCLTLLCAAAAWIFAPAIVRAFAPEFAAVPGKLELTTMLARIMLPFLMLVSVSVSMMGMLNAVHRFFIPAMSPAMFNIATIFAAFALVPLMPRIGWPPVAAIAIGTLLGGVGQIALQVPQLRQEGWRYRPVFDWRDRGLREVLLMMAPATFGLAAVQINVFVNTVLATSQGTGAVSWLNYAFRVMYLPIGLFGVSVGTAALPEISRHAAATDLASMRRTVSTALRLMLMLNIPATIGLIVLARPIVSLLLERGQFGPADTAATAAALTFYAPGLLGYSAVKIVSPSFYALGDSSTPVIVSAISVLANIVLNVMFGRLFGYRGLALGTAIAAALNAALLLWLLRRRLHGLDEGRTARALAAITVASLVMGAVVWLVESWLESLVPGDRTVMRAFRVFTGVGTGVIVLAAAARALHIAEFEDALRRVSLKLMPGSND